MASFLSFLIALNLIVIFSSTSLTSSSTTEVFSKHNPEIFPSTKHNEKITKFHFYWHDTLTGKNPSAMHLVAPPKGSINGFGATNMFDDPLTVGPSPSSKLIGRSQGLYAVASRHNFEMIMVMNFVFTEGVYNGSSISILGRNPILEKVREMPIVGGSGVFRYARGFALVKTYMFNVTSGIAIVEYNVSVLHL